MIAASLFTWIVTHLFAFLLYPLGKWLLKKFVEFLISVL